MLFYTVLYCFVLKVDGFDRSDKDGPGGNLVTTSGVTCSLI